MSPNMYVSYSIPCIDNRPTNTLYMLQLWYRPKKPATEASNEVDEPDVVDEADEAEVADENSVIAPGCLRSVVRWFLLEPVMSV